MNGMEWNDTTRFSTANNLIWSPVIVLSVTYNWQHFMYFLHIITLVQYQVTSLIFVDFCHRLPPLYIKWKYLQNLYWFAIFFIIKTVSHWADKVVLITRTARLLLRLSYSHTLQTSLSNPTAKLVCQAFLEHNII